MTTERPAPSSRAASEAARAARAVRRAGLAFAAIVSGWLAVAAVAAALGRFDALAVPMAAEGFVARLPDGVALADARVGVLVLRGDGLDAQALYAAGAWLVIPARARTCLVLAETR